MKTASRTHQLSLVPVFDLFERQALTAPAPAEPISLGWTPEFRALVEAETANDPVPVIVARKPRKLRRKDINVSEAQ
jgi:hypothetical protein